MARPALSKALGGKVSPEARRRLRKIVDGWVHSPDRVRELRSVEILERIGGKEAGRVLETLAAGAADAPLTIEARAALARSKPTRGRE